MKLTLTQHCALVDLSASERGLTAKAISANSLTVGKLLREGLVVEAGFNTFGMRRYKITESGRALLREEE